MQPPNVRAAFLLHNADRGSRITVVITITLIETVSPLAFIPCNTANKLTISEHCWYIKKVPRVHFGLVCTLRICSLRVLRLRSFFKRVAEPQLYVFRNFGDALAEMPCAHLSPVGRLCGARLTKRSTSRVSGLVPPSSLFSLNGKTYNLSLPLCAVRSMVGRSPASP